MPKKPNSHGNDQEYVPAGNGDASGEYANEQGGNRHFESFIAPTDNTIDTKPQIIKKISQTQSKYDEPKHIKSDFEKHVLASHRKEFAEELIKSYNSLDDDNKAVVNSILTNYNVKVIEKNDIPCYDGKDVWLQSYYLGGDRRSYDIGEVLCHEYWHGADNKIANDNFLSTSDLDHLSDIASGRNAATRLRNYFELSSNCSTSKKLSNGKTLYETITEEFDDLRKSSALKEIKAIYNEEKDNIIKKSIPNYREIKQQYQDLQKRLDQEAEELFPYHWGDKNDDFNKQQDNRIAYKENAMKTNASYQQLANQFDKVFETEVLTERELAKTYMSISDMYGFVYKTAFGFCGGHEQSYTNEKYACAHEFLAEHASAISRNSKYAKRELQILQKYMPKSTAASTELIGLMKNHLRSKKK